MGLLVLTLLVGYTNIIMATSRKGASLSPTELVIHDADVRQYLPINCYYFSLSIGGRNFTSHNYQKSKKYGPNLNCFKLITAPIGYRIELKFEGRYYIEQSENCKYDWLAFQDGAFAFSKEIFRLCGEDEGKTIISTGRYMRMVFKTDDTIEAAGFNISHSFIPIADYEANQQDYKQCYFHVQYSGQGSIEISAATILNFYSRVENLQNIDCVWDIYDEKREKNDKIWIWVEKVTQNTIRKCADRLIEMYAASERLYEEHRSISGKCYQVTNKYFPDSSRVLIRIYSKQLHMMPTIHLNFSTFQEPLQGSARCLEGTYTCEDGRLCLHMNLVCNGYYNCPDGDDEKKAACELKNGHSIGLQFIFIGAAILFFLAVSIALILSARQVIRKHRKMNLSQKDATIISNIRPIKLLQQSTVRLLIEPNLIHHQAGGGQKHHYQSNQNINRCPRMYAGKRGGSFGHRGSWFLNSSISSLSVSSEPKPKRESSSNNIDYLSPASNSLEMKRMRALST